MNDKNPNILNLTLRDLFALVSWFNQKTVMDSSNFKKPYDHADAILNHRNGDNND